MSTFPYSVGRTQTLARAHKMMRDHGVRHLPVLDGGALVGILSQRDLHLIETLRDVNPEEVLVEEAMSSEVYAVAPETPLDEVVRTMAVRKLGCAVVMHEAHVVGILSTVDVCRVLAERLSKSSPRSRQSAARNRARSESPAQR